MAQDGGLGVAFPIFIDPIVAVAYRYEVVDGPAVAAVLVPGALANGDADFTLAIDGIGSFALQAGVEFDMLEVAPAGVSSFTITGIDASAGLDPTDPRAFETGLRFVAGGQVNVTQVALTETLPVPEPATWALWLACAGTAGRYGRDRWSRRAPQAPSLKVGPVVETVDTGARGDLPVTSTTQVNVMLRKLVLALFSLLAVSSAQAAFIGCSPATVDIVVNGVGSTAAFTCNPGAGSGAGSADDNLAGDGWDVTGIRLRLGGNVAETDGTFGQLYSIFYTTDNSLGFGNVFCSALAFADANNQAIGLCTGTGLLVDITAVDVISSFVVTVTGNPGTNPPPSSGAASLFYEVVATQSSAQPLPEPATLGLVALALVGLGAARRPRA